MTRFRQVLVLLTSTAMLGGTGWLLPWNHNALAQEGKSEKPTAIVEKRLIVLAPSKPWMDLTVITAKVDYSLISSHGKGAAKSADSVIADLKSFIQKEPTKESKPAQIQEHKLLTKHQDELSAVFKKMNLIGNQLGKFIYGDRSIPVRLVNKDDSVEIGRAHV